MFEREKSNNVSFILVECTNIASIDHISEIDYMLPKSIFILKPNDTELYIPFRVIDDQEVELTEKFKLALIGDSLETEVDNGEVTITIEDNDRESTEAHKHNLESVIKYEMDRSQHIMNMKIDTAASWEISDCCRIHHVAFHCTAHCDYTI